MSTKNISRFGFIGLLWLGLVYYILMTAKATFTTYFSIIASGIIVFVPMYKKYIKKKQD